jgi:hypothetical protein
VSRQKPKIVITPLIRRALDDVINRVNASEIGVLIDDNDRRFAAEMIDKLAEFTAENAVDPPDAEHDSLAKSNAWIDQKWEDCQRQYFDRLLRIANGEAEIKQSDHEMIRSVMGVVAIKMMVSLRERLVQRLIR